MYTEKNAEIQRVIQLYFDGLYQGNTDLLDQVFAPTSFLHGLVNGKEYIRPKDDFLKAVKDRQSPKDLGESHQMEIMSIEILGNCAFVKVHVPMLGFDYYDFLSLVSINDEWKIVHKLFTNVA